MREAVGRHGAELGNRQYLQRKESYDHHAPSAQSQHAFHFSHTYAQVTGKIQFFRHSNPECSSYRLNLGKEARMLSIIK